MVEDTAAHVLMVSFPGQGHVNPLLRFAKRVAAKGLLVTFSTTTDIGVKIQPPTKAATPGDAIPVGKGSLRFEFFSDGIDADDPRRTDINFYMPQLASVVPAALADLIRRQADEGRRVSCVVNNPFMPWALDVAEELGIPSGVLWVQSASVFSTYYHFHHSLAKFPTSDDPNVSVSLPGLPTLNPDDLPSFLLPSNPYPSLKDVILEQFNNLHKASWVFANTFEELEHDAIRAISKLCDIIPVGPLVETGESGSDIKGDLWKAADCLDWLDSQEPLSVVYVSVGSIVVLSKGEMAEMANGLRDSGKPFLWVVRKDCQELLPEGFVEETEEKGMVITWSPQEQVLSHRSLGCFLTHCGWNSTLETITSGAPVIAYPQWGDQVTDAKFLVHVYGVGVRLASPVSREGMRSCIEEVMVGAKAEEVRRRAAEWKSAAQGAVAAGGSSDKHIQTFVDEIRGRAVAS